MGKTYSQYKIEKYLVNEMDLLEKRDFEIEIDKDPILKKVVQEKSLIYTTLSVDNIKKKIPKPSIEQSKLEKKEIVKHWINQWIIPIPAPIRYAIVFLCAFSLGYIFYPQEEKIDFTAKGQSGFYLKLAGEKLDPQQVISVIANDTMSFIYRGIESYYAQYWYSTGDGLFKELVPTNGNADFVERRMDWKVVGFRPVQGDILEISDLYILFSPNDFTRDEGLMFLYKMDDKLNFVKYKFQKKNSE